MNYLLKTDVLIVGGGPAGTSTALSLLKYSDLKVTIIEQSDLDMVRVGEQVNPSLFELLQYTGIEKSEFDQKNFIHGYSNLAAWGSSTITSRDSIFSNQEENIQLDREQFDFFLLEKASQNGAIVLPRTKCIDFKQNSNNTWEVEAKHLSKGPISIKTKFLIDATGRQSFVSRKIGIESSKKDELVAIGSSIVFEDQTILKHDILIETVEEGWWYCATLPNQKMTVMLFTDATIAKKKQLQKATNLNQLITKSIHIKQKLKNIISQDKIWVKNVFSKLVDTTSRTNYMAVGDAISSFDPISSMGIGFAISSGCNAGKAIIDSEATNNYQYILNYQQNIDRIFDTYLETKKQFYNKELRWKASDFWKKRVGSV